jgi:hypothetical protein
MSRRFLAAVVAGLGLSPCLLAQDVPPPQKQPSNVQSVRIRGCISGRSIRPTTDTDLLTIPESDRTLRLKGSRAMMSTLKEHDGHEDEIVGTTKISNAGKTSVVKEKKTGRGRVYVGVGHDTSPGGIVGTEDVTVDVTGITHVKAQCQR